MPKGIPKVKKDEKYPRNLKPQIVKTTATHKFYKCQFTDCPRPKSYMKVDAKRGHRGPMYHEDCKRELAKIRARADNSPDGRTYEERGVKSLEQFRAEGNTYEICGAKRAKGGVCLLARGFGTDHPGTGNCKYHLGNTQTNNIAAARELLFKQLPTLGSPREIDPHSAILEEVHRTAGHVEWLRLVIAAVGLDPEDPAAVQVAEETGQVPSGTMAALRQFTDSGMQPSVWIELYQRERAHLIRVCQSAVSMGCAERTVRLAEDQGKLIATVIRKVLADPTLALTNAQKAAVPAIVRRELESIDTTAVEMSRAGTN